MEKEEKKEKGIDWKTVGATAALTIGVIGLGAIAANKGGYIQFGKQKNQFSMNKLLADYKPELKQAAISVGTGLGIIGSKNEKLPKIFIEEFPARPWFRI